MKYALILVLSILSISLKAQEQADPELYVKLKLSDWNQIVTILHNAPIVGDVRDPLIQKIKSQGQYQLQLIAQELQKLDSAKKKTDSAAVKPTKTPSKKTTKDGDTQPSKDEKPVADKPKNPNQ